MNAQEFREFAKAAVDYVAEYDESVRDRPVLPEVEPGYLARLLPSEPPNEPENWQQVLQDLDRHIMPGMTHWHSPHFHAYYPAAKSYPSIVGELLSAGLGCMGFSWIASPACTELEMLVTDWLAKILGLPEHFLNSSEGPGGGVLQSSASESTLLSMIAARQRCCSQNRAPADRDKLLVYTSNQANLSVEKAARLADMGVRLLPSDERCSLRGSTLLEHLERDAKRGYVACIFVATLGTTSTCAFDRLDEIGPICRERGIWLHVDAAYAGAAFVCPEYRELMAGIEHVDSFTFNPHKWLLVNADCSVHWIKDSRELTEPFKVDRVYITNDPNRASSKSSSIAPRDYRHWQLSLSRRFRALKIWLVLRLYGVEGLRKHIRDSVGLAQQFEKLVAADERFEMPIQSSMAVVCFRIKGKNELTRRLLDKLMLRRNVYVVPSVYRKLLIIRFVVCSQLTQAEDVAYAWREMSEQAQLVLDECAKDERQLLLPQRVDCPDDDDDPLVIQIQQNGRRRSSGDDTMCRERFELARNRVDTGKNSSGSVQHSISAAFFKLFAGAFKNDHRQLA
ncbi:aromatic-L-amino-acid decarboxylase-like [Trichogramma pretiosum]|uniref:aromatic-L-amino-acid decarboxylase-like n=1 Tax=Trichogramma pretiosum TaxID=7493 RepID=UPI0006C9C676|nr:aromatic-L-amino-acid decarboxylase-like [Trichogramma pretiosum]